MKFYILQEKYVNFEGTFWFDITRHEDYNFIIKLKNAYELKHKDKFYRVVVIYD